MVAIKRSLAMIGFMGVLLQGFGVLDMVVPSTKPLNTISDVLGAR